METEVRQRRQLVTPSGLVIQFKHEQGEYPQAIYRRGKKIEVLSTRRTICEISSEGGDSFYAKGSYGYGQAYCSPSDNFEYELGRQYALRQALVEAPRKVRKEVMDAYLDRTGAQPWRLTADGHVRPKVPRELLMEGPLSIVDRMAISEKIAGLISAIVPASPDKDDAEREICELLAVLVVGR